MTQLSRPIFARTEIRFYDIAEREKAWEWINEGNLDTPGESGPDELE